MAEIETRFAWKSRRQDDGDFHFTATTDEHSTLRVFPYPTGFWGIEINGTNLRETPGHEYRGFFVDAASAISFAEKYGDEIASKQLDSEG